MINILIQLPICSKGGGNLGVVEPHDDVGMSGFGFWIADFRFWIRRVKTLVFSK